MRKNGAREKKDRVSQGHAHDQTHSFLMGEFSQITQMKRPKTTDIISYVFLVMSASAIHSFIGISFSENSSNNNCLQPGV